MATLQPFFKPRECSPFVKEVRLGMLDARCRFQVPGRKEIVDWNPAMSGVFFSRPFLHDLRAFKNLKPET